MSTNNGGPAFPCEEKSWLVDQSGMEPPTLVPTQCSGMTLRDYFAAKAIAALIAEPRWFDGQLSTTFILVDGQKKTEQFRYAKAAYILADAMLAARDAKP